MKVLITAPSLDVKKNVSGISSVVNIIINNNTEAEYIHFLSGKADEEGSGVKRIMPLVKSYTSLFNLSKRNGYDVLHLNLALNTKSLLRDYLIFKIARHFKKPVVTHLHGGKYLTEKPQSRFINNIINNVLKRSDQIVVLSELEKDLVKQQYCGEQITPLPNTVEDIYLQTTITGKSQTTRFFFLGRLNESKGVEFLLKAFNQLTASGANAVLNICGTGPLENVVDESVKQNQRISFHGIVFGPNKLAHIAANDIFVLPSIHGEGLPVALLECMAVGLVPITTTDGSMGRVVIDGENGLIVPKYDQAALYNQMKLLCDKPELLSELSAGAKTYIKENFNIISYINKLNNIYKEAVQSYKSPL